MRPVPARWFELLTSRENLGAVLECLARTGKVQLETYSDATHSESLEQIRAVLDEFTSLSERYSTFWPPPQPPDGDQHTIDLRVIEQVIGTLREWARQAEPLITEHHQLTREFNSLRLIRDWLDSMPDIDYPNLENLAAAGPIMSARLYALPTGTWPTTVGPSVLLHKVETDSRNFVLGAGKAHEIKLLDETMRGLKARCLDIPAWLPAGRANASREIGERRRKIEARQEVIDQRLGDLSTQQDLPALLAHMRFLNWMAREVPQMATTEHFAWVTGWTSDPDGAALESRLDKCGLDHLIRFPPAPERAISPMILHNPAWARSFEVFGKLMGTPSSEDVDPSTIVAFVAPLMFGYMFGDIGQGAVLVAAGLWLRRQYPALALLIPGGVMAMVFGVLFGTVFANENVVPALWLHPLDDPLPVLLVALFFGIGVITLGIVLDAVQAYWSGQGLA
ncbi:MAG: hypothetical protein ACN4GT_02050, partial [Gammaproteobacteria bacterium]